MHKQLRNDNVLLLCKSCTAHFRFKTPESNIFYTFQVSREFVQELKSIESKVFLPLVVPKPSIIHNLINKKD